VPHRQSHRLIQSGAVHSSVTVGPQWEMATKPTPLVEGGPNSSDELGPYSPSLLKLVGRSCRFRRTPFDHGPPFSHTHDVNQKPRGLLRAVKPSLGPPLLKH
jgi:hypothetical protein